LLRRQWTPVLPLVELTRNPQAVELAGEKVVVFRGSDGQWQALLDRCPHRGAALSLGEVTDDGSLQCRYHGWRFRGDGVCSRIPLNDLTPKAVASISATALPVAELAGALWIYTGVRNDEVPPPVLPPSLQGNPRQFGTYSQLWSAHWTRAVENFIDFAHPSYLHRDTIGSWTHAYAEGGAVATVEVEPESWGFRTLNYFGNRRQGMRVDWYRPNLSIVHFGGSAESLLHVFSIPVTANRTRVMTVRRLPPGTDGAAWSARAASMDNTILDEDRVVVESQVGPVDDAGEISVGTDAPSIAFRRWHREMLAAGG
jgi:phenylpropionate dioxygenase-like ring-hydroxylating dioxygenase large terminal subunit